jgi:hypothetical protein
MFAHDSSSLPAGASRENHAEGAGFSLAEMPAAKMPVTRLLSTLLAVLATAACASDTVRAGDGGGPVMLRTAAAPLVSIGVVEGDERYQLVSVASAWKQSDGRIVVLDPGRAALLFFDSTGTLLREAGGRGRGPGEMLQLARGWPYRGDSIAVYDMIQRRMTLYDRDGAHGRSFLNPVTYESRPGTLPSQSCCLIGGVFGDGTFVGHPPDRIPTEAGPDRHSTFTPVWVSADGSRTQEIGTFESALFQHAPASRSGVRGYATSFGFRYTVVGDRLIGGNGFGASLHVASVAPDANGDHIAISPDTLPLPRPGEPFSRELQTAYEQALRADHEADGSRYEGTVDSYLDQPYPATAPGFVHITADADGRVWLERWTPEYSRAGAPVRYDVVDMHGTHVATVDLPAGSRVLWSGNHQVLLLEHDDMDVQYVRLYPLVTDR